MIDQDKSALWDALTRMPDWLKTFIAVSMVVVPSFVAMKMDLASISVKLGYVEANQVGHAKDPWHERSGEIMNSLAATMEAHLDREYKELLRRVERLERMVERDPGSN